MSERAGLPAAGFRLIGMLDSPYVRRVAISMHWMGLPFTHESVSVFRHFDHFSSINPLVKAPTLVTPAGVVLMESGVILSYLESLVPPERRLMPPGAAAARQVGLALTAMEKAVQVYYELTLRPEAARHEPWLERVREQTRLAYAALEQEVGQGGGEVWLHGVRPLQPDLCIAVAWTFVQHVLPDTVPQAAHPALTRFAARAEELPAFRQTPLE